MKRLIAGSAALLGVIAVPAQAQSLGTIINSVLGGGYSNSYQQPYGYQPAYNYGYQPSYGYQTYGYQQPYSYSRSYNGYGYNSYNGYGYQRSYYGSRDYERRRHERHRHHHDENDDNQD